MHEYMVRDALNQIMCRSRAQTFQHTPGTFPAGTRQVRKFRAPPAAKRALDPESTTRGDKARAFSPRTSFARVTPLLLLPLRTTYTAQAKQDGKHSRLEAPLLQLKTTSPSFPRPHSPPPLAWLTGRPLVRVAAAAAAAKAEEEKKAAATSKAENEAEKARVAAAAAAAKAEAQGVAGQAGAATTAVTAMEYKSVAAISKAPTGAKSKMHAFVLCKFVSKPTAQK